eukprot:TRINITY_DN3166_c0_g1_i1.p1 TRINITY_DN3166_c0_g1~~TRINITY_DN3166_c0_g1_i1.p1  ORF type:complete len:509 (+),score=66.13 TRINITY_DN3166_c0_g1_i1:41-1528(+)
MSDARQVPLKQLPSKQKPKQTSVSRFWSEFKYNLETTHIGPITHVAFRPVSPHSFAITSSTRVHVYSPYTHDVIKTFTRFKDVAHSGSFRADGRVLIAGSADSQLKAFDTQSRSILQQFKGHQAAVHISIFAPDKTSVISASDDKTVRFWDFSISKPKVTLKGHTDFVRAAKAFPGNQDLIISGSYDSTVKIWDLRTGTAVFTLPHDSPVEAVLAFSKNNNRVLSGGANALIKVWDLVAGGRLFRNVSNHQKAITSLSFDSTETKLISSSLDQHIKVQTVKHNYNVVHSLKYSKPILSCAMSPDDTHIVAGMADGTLSIRFRVRKGEPVPLLGIDEKSAEESRKEAEQAQRRRTLIQKYENMLKKFEFRQALDRALETGDDLVVYSMLEELVKRGGLQPAVENRNELGLEPILIFIEANISNPEFSSLLIDITDKIIDYYGAVAVQSETIVQRLTRLQRKIADEISFQKQILPMIGCLDLILQAKAKPNPSTVKQ